MRPVRSFAAVLAVLAFAAGPVPAQAPDGPQAIVIEAHPVESFDTRDPGRTRFGALTFRGGLVLTSTHRSFGGLSGLSISADGTRLLAVTDKAYWLRATLRYRGDRPAGIVDAEMAPILGPDGRPLHRRGWYDTESLAVDGGTAYVGIERVHRIVRLDIGRQGLMARAQPVPVPEGVRKLPSNRGLECLAAPPKGGPLAGGLIAISEEGLDRDGNILGFVVGGKSPFAFSVKRSEGFAITDCAVAPHGGLIVLERRFSWTSGVAMRIRRIAIADIRPGATVDGQQLVYADMGYQIDNMEGLALHRAADGQLVLTVISDDNFSFIQRTLLLQFGWAE